ncbi:MAG: Menaquinone via futalosine step 3 [Myxococcales bacterium]|nr:Menaquinone via futalosine step 3 [Myxococcales bacterium]
MSAAAKGKKLRIAAAPFLNTRALISGLAAEPPSGVELQICSPAEGARRLAERECDVALLPVAAFARQGDLVAVPGICIGAKQRVGSVLLVSEVPAHELTTVALDQSSRTSVVLARVLLRERRATRGEPKYEARPPEELTPCVDGARGAVIIGDQALRAVAERRFPYVYDLAELWRQLTGKPFTFAVWAGRADVIDGDVAGLLHGSLQHGLARLDEIAADAGRHGVTPERARSYLREELHFILDEEQVAGADEYLERAAGAGLLPRATLRRLGDAPPTVDVSRAIERAGQGERLSAFEITAMLERGDLIELGAAANRRREALNPDGVVSYIVERNINYTNICVTACRFCAFFRNPGDKDEGYVLSREEMGEKIKETVAAGGVQILLQGGLNPELPLTWYEELFRHLKSTYPIKLHALSPEEILYLCRLESLPLETVLERLVAAGLDSLPGGGAEILVDRVRQRIAKLKCTSSEWLEVMRVGHRLGLRSSSTMMFACGETLPERAEHLLKIRDLQDETGGFTAFICWPFQPGNTRLPGGDGSAHAYLRTLATARLALDNVAHLQASWPTMGAAVGQAALHFGADDFGQVMFEENVVSAAGTIYTMDIANIERHVRAAGFAPVRRDMRYGRLTS